MPGCGPALVEILSRFSSLYESLDLISFLASPILSAPFLHSVLGYRT